MMKLQAFHAKNYRSLANVQLDELPAIALLYGENDSGKSNVLCAIGAWLRLLRYFYEQVVPSKGFLANESFSLEKEEVERILGGSLSEQFRHGTVTMLLAGRLAGRLSQDAPELRCRFEFELNWRQAAASREESKDIVQARISDVEWPGKNTGTLPLVEHSQEMEFFLGFLRKSWLYVSSDRRLHQEVFRPETGDPLREAPEPDASDLLFRLFSCFMGADQGRHALFVERFAPLLKQNSFQMQDPRPALTSDGLLDLMLGGHSVRENGSGIQQWMLIAGLLAVSQAGIAAIEEPEANLSWQSQIELIAALKREIEAQDRPPWQLFLSSHSRLMHGFCQPSSPWFLVTKSAEKTTVIQRMTGSKDLDALFPPPLEFTPARMGLRLYPGNVFAIPQAFIDHLGARPGEFLYPMRQPDGTVLLVSENKLAEIERPVDEEAGKLIDEAGDES